MQKFTFHKILLVTLVLWFLSTSSLLTATIAKHATHGNHDQTSHQQTWCGWLCAAGQGIQSPSLEPPKTFTIIAHVEPFLPSSPSLLLFIISQSRAPPTSA